MGVLVGYAFERKGSTGDVRYTAVYRDLKGRLRSAGTFSNRRRAEDAARDAERDASEGRMPDLKRGRQTLHQYVLGEWFPIT